LARGTDEANTAVIAWGNGLSANQNGGSGLRAIAPPDSTANSAFAGGGWWGGSHAFPEDARQIDPQRLVPPQTRTIKSSTWQINCSMRA